MMRKIWRLLAFGVVGAALVLAAGCSASHSQAAHAHASAMRSAAATSTAVAYDKAQAQKDLQACVATGHVKTTETCLKNDVPKGKRDALGTCLAKAAIAGWKAFKQTGAQACLAVALQ